MNLTCDEKKAAVITTLSMSAKFLGISTIFQFQPTPNKIFYTQCWIGVIYWRGSQKAFLAGYLNHDVIITIYRISMCIFFINLLDLSIIKME